MRKLACALVLFSLSVQAETSVDAKTSIPPPTHFAIAIPGSSWLNVSRPLTTDDLANKIILLDFWNGSGVNGFHVIPEIAKLEQEFKTDLVVIGIHSPKFDTEKETANIRQSILRYGIEEPVVNDRDFRIWRAFAVRSWPTLVLLRPDGEVAKLVTGEGHTGELRKAIRDVVKAFPKRAKRGALPIQLESSKLTQGEFFYPSKLAYDEITKTLFVSDSSHQQIAAFTWDVKNPANLKPAFRVGKSGEAGFSNGTYSAARFRRPQGLLVSHGFLYIADTENHAIRKVDLKSKSVSTIAGTGKQGVFRSGQGLPALSTDLSSPWDVALHPDDENLVIAMAGDHQLWSLDLKTLRMSVIAGNGNEAIDDGLLGEKNTLAQPSGVSSLLGSLYFLDTESSSLRFYFEGYVKTLVGSGLFDFGFKDGERKKAKLQHPLDLFADVTGIYIADTYNHAIRRYDPEKQLMETVIGDGKPGEGAANGPEIAGKTELNEPAGITKLAEGFFAVSDTNNHRIMIWNRATGKVERMKVEGEKTVSVKLEADAVKADSGIVAPKRMSVRLPNRVPMPDAKVNQTNPVIKIMPPEGYALNAEAPSFARFFAGSPPKEILKQEWQREDLAKSLSLKPSDLKVGTDYFFQGSFYFCLEAKNAVCESASLSFPVRVDPTGTDRVDVNLAGASAR